MAVNDRAPLGEGAPTHRVALEESERRFRLFVESVQDYAARLSA